MTLKLAYCDYIAARIHTLIDRELTDNQTMIESVTQPKMDLHPTEMFAGMLTLLAGAIILLKSDNNG